MSGGKGAAGEERGKKQAQRVGGRLILSGIAQRGMGGGGSAASVCQTQHPQDDAMVVSRPALLFTSFGTSLVLGSGARGRA